MGWRPLLKSWARAQPEIKRGAFGFPRRPFRRRYAGGAARLIDRGRMSRLLSPRSALIATALILLSLLVPNAPLSGGLPHASPLQLGPITLVASAPAPTGATISSGGQHALALRGDGTVWSWGNNYEGQLGDGTTSGSACAFGIGNYCHPTPEQVTVITGMTQVAAGGFHSLALKSDGTVWAWGLNAEGQLGDGTTGGSTCGNTVCHPTPEQVPGLSGVKAVAAGHEFSIALKSDGTVWAWGMNNAGEVGNGTVSSNACLCIDAPTQVTGLSGIASVAAGISGYNGDDKHVLALKSDGSVWAWGYDGAGQVGDGTVGSGICACIDAPVQVPGLSGIAGVAAGGNHSLALRADGTVFAWGSDAYGELGNGTSISQPTSQGCWCLTAPVQVTGLSAVISISAQDGESSAITSDNTVWDWGTNGSGELGLGTNVGPQSCNPSFGGGSIACGTAPQHVTSPNETVELATGSLYSLALRADGTVWDWGTNDLGELANGTVATSGCYCVATPAASLMTGVALPPVGPQEALFGGPISSSETFGMNNFCWVCSLRALGEPNLGDPVNTSNGNFTETATDLSIAARGFPLQFSRSYNSLAATTNGPLGYGWTSNLIMSLSQPGGTGPVTITQEGGSQVTFTQTGSTYTPAEPRDIAALTKNLDGTWTFVRMAKDTFTFSAAGLLTGEQDLNGYATTFSYNASNQITTITDSAQRTLTIGWTGSNMTSVTDANVSPARTVTYGYNDGAGDLTDVIDVNGGHTHFGYDSSHRATSMQDPNCYVAGTACNGGNGVVNHYDNSGRVDWQQDQLGRKTTFAYSGDPNSSTGGTTTVTDPKGNVSVESFQYGLRTAVTRGYGTSQAATWSYTYDLTTGALVSSTDPNKHTTRFGVDASGNQLWKVDPLGRLVTSTYSSFNEPLTRIDGLKLTTTYSYDSHANLTSISRPLLDVSGNVIATQLTQYNHGDANHPGDVTSMVDPDNKTWTYGYDSYGNRNSTSDPLGDRTTLTFNADNWLLTSVSARGNVSGCNCASQYTTTYGYVDSVSGKTNEFGDVETITDPLGHITANHYDADRNITSTTDSDGNTTSYTFDLANEQSVTTRADQTTTRTDYNLDGTVLDEKDGKGNAILTFGYDAQARMITKTDALTNVTTYGYDGAGNQLTQQDPGGNCSASPATGCTSRVYDPDNELTSISYSDGVTPNVTSISYDADGQRIGMTDGTGTSSWVLDSLYRLTSYTDGHGDKVQFGYNLRNQVTQLIYPGSLTVTRGYDDAGRWTSVQDWLSNLTSFVYDPDGELTTKTLPSSTGVVDTNAFNAAGQLTSISDVKGGSNTLFSATYGRDNYGQITSDSSVPSTVRSDRYTQLNQLCFAGSSNSSACSSPPTGAQIYSYDAAGNVTTDNGTTQSFNAADRICWTLTGNSSNGCGSAPRGATKYSYNAQGDRITVTPSTGSVTNLGYDQANRLKSWGQGSTTTATYAYNGDGLRMSKTVSGVTTPYTWDTSGRLALLIADGASQYVYGPGGTLLEQVTARPAISLVGTSTASGKSSSLKVTLPTGVQANDEVFLASTQPSTTTVTAPSGYTSVASITSGGSSPLATTAVFRHTLAAGETSVTLTYSTNKTAQAAVLAVYRGVDQGLPIDGQATGSAAASTTVTAPSVAPAYANDQLIVFQGAVGTFSNSTTWSAPSGTTERAQVNPANTSTGVSDQALTASGATGNRVSTFGQAVNLATVILATPQPPTVLFYQTDQLGTTRVLADGIGSVRGTFTYDPYGNLTASSGSYSTPFGYSGEYRDAETGFIHLRARYYDPLTGQFITQDPAIATTRQPYSYVKSNPLNATDPSGLWCGWLQGTAGIDIGLGNPLISQNGNLGWGSCSANSNGAAGLQSSIPFSIGSHCFVPDSSFVGSPSDINDADKGYFSVSAVTGIGAGIGFSNADSESQLTSIPDYWSVAVPIPQVPFLGGQVTWGLHNGIWDVTISPTLGVWAGVTHGRSDTTVKTNSLWPW
jgi:RHS repeat-associated protein